MGGKNILFALVNVQELLEINVVQIYQEASALYEDIYGDGYDEVWTDLDAMIGQHIDERREFVPLKEVMDKEGLIKRFKENEYFRKLIRFMADREETLAGCDVFGFIDSKWGGGILSYLSTRMAIIPPGIHFVDDMEEGSLSFLDDEEIRNVFLPVLVLAVEEINKDRPLLSPGGHALDEYSRDQICQILRWTNDSLKRGYHDLLLSFSPGI